MKNNKTDFALRLLSWAVLIVIIGCWQAGADKGLVNIMIFSSPARIASKCMDMIRSGSLVNYILVSLGRVWKGYVIGGGLGLILGIMIGLFPGLEKVTGLYIGIFRPIPAIAWIPFLLLAFGIGEASKIAVIAIGSFWSLLLNTISGIKSTDKMLLELGDVLEKDKKTKILKIMLPSAIPSIFTGARLGISRAWSCVVTAEMIAASAGLGYLIQYARELSQPALMLVGVTSIGLIGLLIDCLTLKLEKRLLYWNDLK